MILTVTLNPAIDKVLVLNQFKVHKLHRLKSSELSMILPGGKGVNVALTLKLLGNEVITTGFTGGYTGHLLCDQLRERGITTSFVFTEGITRTNTSILDLKNETLTEINDFGKEIEHDDVTFFLDNYSRLLHRARMVVIAGSLPRGVNDDVHLSMIDKAREMDIKVIVHTSPDHLDALFDSSPFIIYPDMRSYHKLMGQPCDGIKQFVNVGKEILNRNKKTEYVIFTHRIENVVVVKRSKSYILRPENLKIVNMLGYGDAYLAGFVHAYHTGKPEIDILKYASSAGLTNVENLYKDIRDVSLIDKNIDRIKVEVLA
ncbi:MAG: hypothetical protein JW894_05395 [Bacteroidales bacterium]|nr:hypothetical protein [Bacteroidales bacterium]